MFGQLQAVIEAFALHEMENIGSKQIETPGSCGN